MQVCLYYTIEMIIINIINFMEEVNTKRKVISMMGSGVMESNRGMVRKK